jgi:NTP pyrophosphatase (non-canonical NTP hydrolase)
VEIKKLCEEAHLNAKAHGFWEDYSPALQYNMRNNAICARLMLIVGEVAEAQEGLRKDDISNFKEELADVVIRLADLCGGLDINLEHEITKKMAINKDRPYKHNKSF